MTDEAVKNFDVELYREPDETGAGDFYSDSIHVTEGGGIGINVGGYVVVKTLREWHDLATQQVAPSPRLLSGGTQDFLKKHVDGIELEDE